MRIYQYVTDEFHLNPSGRVGYGSALCTSDRSGAMASAAFAIRSVAVPKHFPRSPVGANTTVSPGGRVTTRIPTIAPSNATGRVAPIGRIFCRVNGRRFTSESVSLQIVACPDWAHLVMFNNSMTAF
jgi:hypothetical protein